MPLPARAPITAVILLAGMLACRQDDAYPLSPTHQEPLADKVNPVVFDDPTGQSGTISTNGSIDLGNPFFQNLGTNGRTCATCHLQQSGFSFSVADAQAKFGATGGTDPLFAAVDGANCPSVTPAD